jgi:16S rRNA (adenine1518-N6/adenine1519-N6)-dimethyltransferase
MALSSVKPKKELGQHFLKDKHIAHEIVAALTFHKEYKSVLEIGPGTGVLTEILVPLSKSNNFDFSVIDIDRESVDFLKEKGYLNEEQIILGDFLKMDLNTDFPEPFGIIGNFPYNISSQIFFTVLDYREKVNEVVCMIQKEVAERIASEPGRKANGILSIFLQAFYEIEYLFTVPPHVFIPPPKVNSAVIRLRRNSRTDLGCDEKLFRNIVKTGFNQRRKMLRNALKPLNIPEEILNDKFFDLRAEQLDVEDFIALTNRLSDKV